MSKPPVQEENDEENFRDSDAETINPEARDSLDEMDDELPEADRDTIYGLEDVEEAQKNVHTIAEKSQTALKFNPIQAKSAFASMKAVLEGTKTNEEKVAEIEVLQNGVEDTATQAFANVAKGVLGLQETQATAQEKSATLEELVSEFGFIENLGDDEKDPAAKEQCSLNMVQAVGAMQAKKDADGKLIEPAVARDNLNPHIAEAIQTSFQGTVNDAIEVESHAAEEKKKSEVRISEDYKDLDITPAIKCGKAAVAIGLAFVPGVGIFLAIGFLIATRNMGNGPQQEDGEEKESDLPDMDLLEYGEEFLKDFLESGEGAKHPHQEHEEEELEPEEEVDLSFGKKPVHAKPSVAAKNPPEEHEQEHEEEEVEEGSGKKPVPAKPNVPAKNSPAKKVVVASAIDDPEFSFNGMFGEEPQVEEEGDGLGEDGRESDVDDVEREEGELEYEGWEDDLGTVQESLLGAPTSPYQSTPARFSAPTAQSNTTAAPIHDATAEDVLGLTLREEEGLGDEEGLWGYMEDQSTHEDPPAEGLQPPSGVVWMSLGDMEDLETPVTETLIPEVVTSDIDTVPLIVPANTKSSKPFGNSFVPSSVNTDTTSDLYLRTLAGLKKASPSAAVVSDNPLVEDKSSAVVDAAVVLDLTSRSHVDIGEMDASSKEFMDLTGGPPSQVGMEAKKVEVDVTGELSHNHNVLGSTHRSLVRTSIENHPFQGEAQRDQEGKSVVATKVNDVVVAEVDAVNDAELLADVKVDFSDHEAAKSPSTLEKVWNRLFNRPAAAASVPEEIEMATFTSSKSSLTAEQVDLLAASGKAQSQFTQNPVAGNSSVNQEEDEMRDEDYEEWDEPEESRLLRKFVMGYQKMNPTTQQSFESTELLEPDEESMDVEEPHLNSPVTVATTDEEFSQSEARAAAKEVMASTNSLSDFSEEDGKSAHSPHMANPAKVKDKDAKVV